MTILVTFIVLILCVGLLAIGYIFARKTLFRGCSLGPECLCKKEGKSPDHCEYETDDAKSRPPIKKVN